MRVPKRTVGGGVMKGEGAGLVCSSIEKQSTDIDAAKGSESVPIFHSEY